MIRIVSAFFFALALFACKSKKKRPEIPATNFFPAPAYVRGELKRLDTSHFTFKKIETINGHADTTTIKNTDVRLYASEFLALPDISSPELKNDYEVSHLYDDMQGAFVFNFMTTEAHPLREENITVEPLPNAAGKNDIKSIYAKIEQDSGNVSITKILLWEAGKGFYTTSIFDAPNKAEQIKKVQIIWNGFDSQNK